MGPVNCARILLLASFSAAFNSALQAWLQCSRNGCSATPGSLETPPDMLSSTSILSTGSQPFHVLLWEPEGSILAIISC